MLGFQYLSAVHRMGSARSAGSSFRWQTGMGRGEDEGHQSSGSQSAPQAKIPQGLAVYLMPSGSQSAKNGRSRRLHRRSQFAHPQYAASSVEHRQAERNRDRQIG